MRGDAIKELTALLRDIKSRDTEAAQIVASILGIKLGIHYLYTKAEKDGSSSAKEALLIEVMRVLANESANVLTDTLKDSLRTANPTLHDVVSAELRDINAKLDAVQ